MGRGRRGRGGPIRASSSTTPSSSPLPLPLLPAACLRALLGGEGRNGGRQGGGGESREGRGNNLAGSGGAFRHKSEQVKKRPSGWWGPAGVGARFWGVGLGRWARRTRRGPARRWQAGRQAGTRVRSVPFCGSVPAVSLLLLLALLGDFRLVWCGVRLIMNTRHFFSFFFWFDETRRVDARCRQWTATGDGGRPGPGPAAEPRPRGWPYPYATTPVL